MEKSDTVKKKNKIVSYLKILITLIIIGVVVWVVIIYPRLTFSRNEDKFLTAAKRYFEINASKVPSEGKISTVTLQTLYHQDYVDDIKTVYKKDSCNTSGSWVKVKREGGEYKYFVYLECGSLKSVIDHDGPNIVLNGKEKIVLEKGSKFEDPGIKSVKDTTDGDIDIKNVTVSGKVNTNKVGTYKIKYSVKDSLLNETVKTRVVVVQQSISSTIKSDNNNSKVYKGAVLNNYIKFSGQLYRIVGLNSDGTVKIVSNDDVGSVNYDDIYKWLDEVYYDSLTSEAKDMIVTNYKFCNDQINDKELDKRVKCVNNTNKQKVGILSIADYNSSLDKNNSSYLYTNTINWMSDYNDKNSAWTTRTYFNGTDSNYYLFSRKYNFSVRPVVILKKGLLISDGDGTYNDPYIIDNFKKGKVGDKINTRYSGEYVKYGDRVYRIVKVEGGYTKVVSTGPSLQLNIGYSDKVKTKVYNPSESGNIGYYIENNVSKYIKSDIFVKHKVVVPIYSGVSTYSGKKKEKTYSVKFSAPNIYDLYSSVGESDYWLINSSTKEDTKYMVSSNMVIRYTTLNDSQTANVRFSAYLGKNVTILSGNGTKDNPYQLQK